MIKLLSLVAFCALYATAPNAHAQLYKWVDESGVVNYGDWPPAGVKLQPVNHGTMSSVADRALVGTAARTQEPARSGARTGGPQPPAGRDQSQPSGVSAPTGDVVADGTYAPYYDTMRRPLAVEAAADRRRGDLPVVKPLLPIDPAIPDMPLRPRR
jgi:hypothetical protein